MMELGLLSSAIPIGFNPTWVRSSTNENSSATIRFGVPWITIEPSVPLTVRVAVRAGPQVGSNAFCDLGALTPAPARVRAPIVKSRTTAPIRLFTAAPFVLLELTRPGVKLTPPRQPRAVHGDVHSRPAPRLARRRPAIRRPS